MMEFLFNLMCNCCEYMKTFTDSFMDLEYYIVGEYGNTAVTIYNIVYAVILGVFTFATIYIIIPSISAFIILCFCSICVEIYEKIMNTFNLFKNIMLGIKNDIKLFLDGALMTFIFIYCFYPLLFKN